MKHYYLVIVTSWVAQKVKYLAAVQETRIQSLGQEDPLEKGMATHSSTVAWKIPWTAEPGGLQPMGSHRVRPNWVTNSFTFTLYEVVAKVTVVLDLEFYTRFRHIFISQNRNHYSVLSCHSKDLKWQTHVAVWLPLRVLLSKQRIVHSQGMRPQRRGLNPSWLPPFIHFCPRCWACPMQIALARRAVCFTWGSHSGPWIFFCSIFTGFFLFLSFNHCHFGLLFPILTT